MSTFGISQNFRATSIIGRFGRTAPEKVIEKVIDDEEDHDEEDEDDEDEDEDEDTSKKAKALKALKAKAASEKALAAKAAAKKSDERVSSATQFVTFMNRYAEKTADHH
jgi:hypothetical protein